MTNCSVNDFKTELDKVLSIVPDEPNICISIHIELVTNSLEDLQTHLLIKSVVLNLRRTKKQEHNGGGATSPLLKFRIFVDYKVVTKL